MHGKFIPATMDNSITTIIKWIKSELEKIYGKEEIQSLIFLILNETARLSKIDVVAGKKNRLTNKETVRIREIVSKLKNNKPIQYIFGKTVFYGFDIKVSPYVLIPRPETEELIDWILKKHENSQKELTFLDVGTGSGCICITLAKHLPKNRAYAMDFSKEALEIAGKNAENQDVSVNFICDDILNPSEKIHDLPYFDIIVSNPPYVCQSEQKLMHENVLDYEPGTALIVPDDNPLLFYKAIANYARKKLKSNGYLYFEINERFGCEMIELMQQHGFSEIILQKDINNKDRMISGMKKTVD